MKKKYLVFIPIIGCLFAYGNVDLINHPIHFLSSAIWQAISSVMVMLFLAKLKFILFTTFCYY